MDDIDNAVGFIGVAPGGDDVVEAEVIAGEGVQIGTAELGELIGADVSGDLLWGDDPVGISQGCGHLCVILIDCGLLKSQDFISEGEFGFEIYGKKVDLIWGKEMGWEEDVPFL